MVSEDVSSVAAMLESMTRSLKNNEDAELISLACSNLSSLAEQVRMLEAMTPPADKFPAFPNTL